MKRGSTRDEQSLKDVSKTLYKPIVNITDQAKDMVDAY
jgi:hypothetical protein